MKILRDTLKKPNGRFDKQSLQMFTSFIVSIVFGAYIVFSDWWLEKEINSYAIVVEGYFVALAGGQAYLSMINKKVDVEYNIDREEPNQEIHG